MRDFDSYVTAETSVVGAIYLAHTARADLLKDFVRAEFVTWRERHLLDLR